MLYGFPTRYTPPPFGTGSPSATTRSLYLEPPVQDASVRQPSASAVLRTATPKVLPANLRPMHSPPRNLPHHHKAARSKAW